MGTPPCSDPVRRRREHRSAWSRRARVPPGGRGFAGVHRRIERQHQPRRHPRPESLRRVVARHRPRVGTGPDDTAGLVSRRREVRCGRLDTSTWPGRSIRRSAETTWHVPPVAAQLVERAPSLYNPLPEVFAERFGRVDGPARLPVASPSCSKVLLVGRGRPHMSWPIPCVPREPPPDCLVAGHLCYANRQADGSFVFAVPPRQPGFAIADDSADLVWSDVSEFAGLPVPFPWGELRETPPLSDHSIFRDAEHVRRIRAFQADTATIAFVEPLDEHAPRVRIRPGAPTRLWWIRRAGLTVVATGEVTVESWVHAPTSEPLDPGCCLGCRVVRGPKQRGGRHASASRMRRLLAAGSARRSALPLRRGAALRNGFETGPARARRHGSARTPTALIIFWIQRPERTSLAVCGDQQEAWQSRSARHQNP